MYIVQTCRIDDKNISGYSLTIHLIFLRIIMNAAQIKQFMYTYDFDD